MSFLNQDVMTLAAPELTFLHNEADKFFAQCEGSMDSLVAHTAAYEASVGDLKRAEEFLSSVAFASFFFLFVGITVANIMA